MEILDISKGLLTPAIAMIAIWIAWQQSQTNRYRFKLERYDRRLRIYEEVRSILSFIMRDAKVNVEDLMKFRKSVSEADFLFGPEIPTYIDEIYSRGLNLWLYSEEIKSNAHERAEGYDHKKVIAKKFVELNWLVAQIQPAKAKFKKYLEISK